MMEIDWIYRMRRILKLLLALFALLRRTERLSSNLTKLFTLLRRTERLSYFPLLLEQSSAYYEVESSLNSKKLAH